MFENYSENLEADLNKFFKQKIKYMILKKIKISISNFITEINCIKIENLNKINDNYIFYTNKQIQKNFKSSFLDKILKRVEEFNEKNRNCRSRNFRFNAGLSN